MVEGSDICSQLVVSLDSGGTNVCDVIGKEGFDSQFLVVQFLCGLLKNVADQEELGTVGGVSLVRGFIERSKIRSFDCSSAVVKELNEKCILDSIAS